MYNRDRCFYTFLSFLNKNDKLALRQVNHNLGKNLANTQESPYISKLDFLLGIGTSNQLYNKHFLNTAWSIYQQTMNSASMKPALIYKMKDLSELEANGIMNQFSDGENIYKEARIYTPFNMHTWGVNKVWLLAQIHKGRPFTIHSELKDKYIRRELNQNCYSAFAKEIATAMKAGYIIHDNILKPFDNDAGKQLTANDIDPSDNETIQSILCVKESHFLKFPLNFKKMHTINLANNIIDYSNKAHVFKDKIPFLKDLISKILDKIFQNTDENNKINTFNFLIDFLNIKSKILPPSVEKINYTEEGEISNEISRLKIIIINQIEEMILSQNNNKLSSNMVGSV